MGAEPVWGCGRQHIQRMPQGLCDGFESGHGSDCRQNVGGVASLTTTRLHQATALCDGENSVKDTPLSPMREQTGAKLTQHGIIKTNVSQFQAQQILPSDP